MSDFVILFCPSHSYHSHYTFSDVKEIARESNIQLYTIDVGGYSIPMGTRGNRSVLPGRAVLEELVSLTGGQAFFTTDVRKLEDISSRISEDLRNQYVLGYIPTNSSKNGKWRKLRLKVNPSSQVSVHAKSGYYAPID